jgi:hypothetical protein
MGEFVGERGGSISNINRSTSFSTGCCCSSSSRSAVTKVWLDRHAWFERLFADKPAVKLEG